MEIKVLLLGSGGREQALFHKIGASTLCSSIDVCPGNAGFPRESILNCNPNDFNELRKIILKNKYDLVVVGPEQLLVDGIVDALADICPVFGPSRLAAQLEGSKIFSKTFMQKYNIPTARAEIFSNFEKALAYASSQVHPIVIKADGLAAGKGVVVTNNFDESKSALEQAMKSKIFGEAGTKVLIEEFIEGQEISIFALCDGECAQMMLPSQDHKRVGEMDQGANTGGMGAYAPVPFVHEHLKEKIKTEVFDKVIEGMKKEGTPFHGLLYAGLMVHNENVKVIEFNVRFGDPETQVILNLLEDDLLPLLLACTQKKEKLGLKSKKLNFKNASALVIVLAAEGYPREYKKNILLNDYRSSIENKNSHSENEVLLYHAGTIRNNENILSSGGRVLNVVAQGENLEIARSKAYNYIKAHFDSNKTPHLFYRKDIGLKGISISK